MNEAREKKTSNLPIALLLIVVIGWMVWKVFFPRSERIDKILHNYDSVPVFSLKDISGKLIGLEDLKGKIWVASFVSSRSKGIKKTLTQTYSIMRSVKMHKNVVMVSFNSDPDHDNPGIMSDMMKGFNVPSGHWYVLSGPKDTVLTLMRKGFKLGYSENQDGKGISHSLKFILVDWKGFIRGYYDSQDNESRKKLLVAIGQLLKEVSK